MCAGIHVLHYQQHSIREGKRMYVHVAEATKNTDVQCRPTQVKVNKQS